MKNVPHNFELLNAWSPGGGAVWKGLIGVAL